MQSDSLPTKRKMPRGFVHEQRYVVAVDGQRKASYADPEAALAHAKQIQAEYPRLSVEIHDQQIKLEVLLKEMDRTPNPEPWPD